MGAPDATDGIQTAPAVGRGHDDDLGELPHRLPTRPGGVGVGVDIGGTGMKAAPVDLGTGELVGPRVRIDTPKPATPEAMAEVFARLVGSFEFDGPIGATLPAVVRHGVVGSAANIDRSWLGVDADELFAAVIGREVTVVNDADAAGIAEMRFGAGRGRTGVVLVLTFGTGIGSGLFVDGHLVPNTELGHLEIDGEDAEWNAAASARERHRLTWPQWAPRAQRYLEEIVKLFSPDLIIIGGGASKRSSKWLDLIDIDAEIEVAAMTNNAGIVGAAILRSDLNAAASRELR
jgi:polyphosphate glucokinase